MQKRAFTLVELLVVMAVIGLLAALLLPAIHNAKDKSRRTICSANLRQINLGLRMYADDSDDAAPRTSSTGDPTFSLVGYKRLIQRYVGHDRSASAQARLFTCPADTFYYEELTGSPYFVPRGLWEQPVSDHSSYAFNGANAITNSRMPGISGRTMSSIKHPTKTVLVADGSAYAPWSWHQPKKPFSHQNAIFKDAMNMVSFVDGHLSYIKIFWDRNRSGLALSYDPPSGYDYQWSGD